MVIFAWDHKLETGVEQIDQEHMQIMLAANRLLVSRKGDDALRDALHFLTEYIGGHFREEEALQRACGYAHYEAHRAQHTMISNKLQELCEELAMSNYAEAAVENFYSFLCKWISQHIMEQDADFAQAYRAFTAGRA